MRKIYLEGRQARDNQFKNVGNSFFSLIVNVQMFLTSFITKFGNRILRCEIFKFLKNIEIFKTPDFIVVDIKFCKEFYTFLYGV